MTGSEKQKINKNINRVIDLLMTLLLPLLMAYSLIRHLCLYQERPAGVHVHADHVCFL